MKVKRNPCVRRHTEASQGTHIGLSVLIKVNRRLIWVIGCGGMPESTRIYRWTRGCYICTAFLWLSPFCLVKIFRGAAAEISMGSLHEHFPRVRTSCTTVEPAHWAARRCSRSSAPQKASATGGTFSPTAWCPSQNCGIHRSAHMGTTVMQEVSPSADSLKQDCFQVGQSHLSPISEV